MTTTPLAEPKKTAPKKPAQGEPCPNCGTVEPWGSSSWCPACGFYPALGGTSLKSADEVEAGGETSHLEAWETMHQGPSNLLEAIPAWGWITGAGMFLVLAANVAARVMLPLKASHRTLLTLSEFSLGFIIAGIAHFSTYLYAACRNDKYAPFDFFMKPIEIWKPTFQKMPEGARRLYGMAWGMTAMFAALLVMAGFSFDSLFEDWGFEKREKTSLVKEAVKQARKRGNGDEDLEGAIKEFVGEGELEDEATPPLETQCVIIGYTKTEKGELNTLIIASAPRGRLAYVGFLAQPEIPEASRAEILEELQLYNELKSCYIKQGVPLKKAIWIEPKVLCLIEHKSWSSQYTLQQPLFLKIVRPEEEKEKEEKSAATEAMEP